MIGPASKTVFSFSIAALHRVLQTKRELLCTLDPAVKDTTSPVGRPEAALELFSTSFREMLRAPAVLKSQEQKKGLVRVLCVFANLLHF